MAGAKAGRALQAAKAAGFARAAKIDVLPREPVAGFASHATAAAVAAVALGHRNATEQLGRAKNDAVEREPKE